MNNYFGTDGIRGVVNSTLTTRTAFSLGNALAKSVAKPTVVICRDNRVSSDMLMLAVGAGVTAGGGKVLDCGVLPTAACAYLTKKYSADFGVMISASHNPPEFNGIKVFDSLGCKISTQKERKLEKYFNEKIFLSATSVGSYNNIASAKQDYIDYLVGACRESLSGLHFILDCANGAAGAVAPAVFEKLGAKITLTGASSNGLRINDGCGALFAEKISKLIKSVGADAGFCYDGDADRLIAVDEKGNIIDGDKIICIFANLLKSQNKLNHDTVVGTAHTNTGAESWLLERGINLFRTDIGDKFVGEHMRLKGLSIGGEQSGHIILSEYSTTGDGILSSIKLAELINSEKLSSLSNIPLYPQYNISVKVKDKVRVLGDENVGKTVRECANKLGRGRLVVRASGTEPVIRIFAEAENYSLAKQCAERVKRAICKLKE